MRGACIGCKLPYACERERFDRYAKYDRDVNVVRNTS